MASWQSVRAWWQGRAEGRPPVARSGVSSFHAWWQDWPSNEPIVDVAVTIEVVTPPAVDKLYFWALQASFSDGRRGYGAAHLGLQWNPLHPGLTAVNWGGYGDPSVTSSVLSGSRSTLPSRPNDENTRDYPWRAGVPYTLRIQRAADGWAGSVTDGSSGVTHEVRRLFAGGERLTSPIVWAEVFAGCSDPPTEVRWSSLTVVTASGQALGPQRLRLTFPADGCPNTDTVVDVGGVRSLTNVTRTGRDGAVVVAPPR